MASPSGSLNQQTKEEQMKIIIEQKQVYGKTLFYPVCQTAQIFSDLTRTKTLDRFQLQKIKSLGYSIELKQQELEVI
jgi:hypothetical protein